MISIDDLFLLSTRLWSASLFRNAIVEQLRGLAASPEYQAWLGSLAEAQPFRLPSSLDPSLLQDAGLARCGRLECKLNLVGSGVFVTDGVWIDQRVRVFPFSDESRTLTGFVRRTGLADTADWVLDLATGCGINALSLGRPSLGFDINPRALAYAAINRALNGVAGRDCTFVLNDIRDGIPPVVLQGLRGRILVVANMPFGPAPSSDALPLTSNGGESGAALQFAAYRAIANMIDAGTPRLSVQACLMGLTVGDRAADRWEIVERAVERFGPKRVRWHLLHEEHVFRIDGVRQMGNPAQVACALPGLASCRLYTPDDTERDAKVAAFADLARRHATRGNPDIAYGIVEILPCS